MHCVMCVSQTQDQATTLAFPVSGIHAFAPPSGRLLVEAHVKEMEDTFMRALANACVQRAPALGDRDASAATPRDRSPSLSSEELKHGSPSSVPSADQHDYSDEPASVGSAAKALQEEEKPNGSSARMVRGNPTTTTARAHCQRGVRDSSNTSTAQNYLRNRVRTDSDTGTVVTHEASAPPDAAAAAAAAFASSSPAPTESLATGQRKRAKPEVDAFSLHGMSFHDTNVP